VLHQPQLQEQQGTLLNLARSPVYRHPHTELLAADRHDGDGEQTNDDGDRTPASLAKWVTRWRAFQPSRVCSSIEERPG